MGESQPKVPVFQRSQVFVEALHAADGGTPYDGRMYRKDIPNEKALKINDLRCFNGSKRLIVQIDKRVQSTEADIESWFTLQTMNKLSVGGTMHHIVGVQKVEVLSTRLLDASIPGRG